MALFINPSDAKVLSDALKWVNKQFPADSMADLSGTGWAPIGFDIWNEEVNAKAGSIQWHGDGFWVVVPTLYNLPGGE